MATQPPTVVLAFEVSTWMYLNNNIKLFVLIEGRNENPALNNII